MSFLLAKSQKEGASVVDQETELALVKQEIGFLKGEIASIKADVKEKFDRIEKKLDEALKGRPTWFVFILLSGLMTICTGLAVYILTKG